VVEYGQAVKAVPFEGNMQRFESFYSKVLEYQNMIYVRHELKLLSTSEGKS
jgi:hypothetical protein